MMTQGEYSIAELVRLRLSTLPKSRQCIERLVSREKWLFREVNSCGRNGVRRVYAPPAHVLEAIVKQAASSAIPDESESAGLAPVASEDLTSRQRLIRDARLLVVRKVHQLRNLGTSTNRAAETLLHALASGELAESVVLAMAIGNDKNGFVFDVVIGHEGVLVGVPGPDQKIDGFAAMTSARTLRRWCQAHAERGADGLIPLKRQRDMTTKPWVPYFLQHMQRPQKPMLTDAYRAMVASLPEGIERPSIHAVRRWYDTKYSNIDKLRGRHQGSALNAFKFSHKRTNAGMVPMLEVHSDGWGTHFTAPHPVSGKFVKLECWHTHDVATRVVFPPSVGLSESMIVIMGSLSNAMKAGGVPAIWQTDNTGSVKNDRIEFDPLTSIKARAGFEIVHNLPGNSQANGICENFNKYLDRRARELATYMSKDMDSLAQKRVLKLTQKMSKVADLGERRRLKAQAEAAGSGIVFETYQQAVDWLNQVCQDFNHMPHSALPRVTTTAGVNRHMTPAEAWQEHVRRGWEPVALDADELVDVFRPHETKTVRRGCVTVFGQRYHHTELEHFNGEEVQVAYDIENGERVFVKSLDGRLICEAQFYVERAYRPRSAYEIAMDKRAEAAIKRHAIKIGEIERQRPVVTLEAEMAQQRLADPARGAPVVIDVDATDCADSVVQSLPESPETRFSRWLTLDARHERGEALSDAEARWHAGYPLTAEHRLMTRRAEDNANAM